MVEDVGHDGGVNVTGQILDVDAVVEIGQVSLLASGLDLLTDRVSCCLRRSCLNHDVLRYMNISKGNGDDSKHLYCSVSSLPGD